MLRFCIRRWSSDIAIQHYIRQYCYRLLAGLVLWLPGPGLLAFPKLGLLRHVSERGFKSLESVKVSLWAVSVTYV